MDFVEMVQRLQLFFGTHSANIINIKQYVKNAKKLVTQMLYKCNKKKVRYTIMITSFIVVIYRIINMFMVPSIFTGFMLLVSFVLIMHLLFY